MAVHLRLTSGGFHIDRFGTRSGSYRDLKLKEDEYLNSIKWWKGKFVDAVQFSTVRLGGHIAWTGRWGGGGGNYRGEIKSSSNGVFMRLAASTGTQWPSAIRVLNGIGSNGQEKNRVEKIVLSNFQFEKPVEPEVVKVVLDEQSRSTCNGEQGGDFPFSYTGSHQSMETLSLPSFPENHPTKDTSIQIETSSFYVSAVDPMSDGSITDFEIGKVFSSPGNTYSSSIPMSLSDPTNIERWEVLSKSAGYYEFVYDYYWTATAKAYFRDGRVIELSQQRGHLYGSKIMSTFVEAKPSECPSAAPSLSPSTSAKPSVTPSSSTAPSNAPSLAPSSSSLPSRSPSSVPSWAPSEEPSLTPTVAPSTHPSPRPSVSLAPSVIPSSSSAPSDSGAPSSHGSGNNVFLQEP